MRRVRTVVLPVPAPAMTRSGPRTCSMAARWLSSRTMVERAGAFAVAIGSSIAEQVVDVLCESGELGESDCDGGDGRSFGAQDGWAERSCEKSGRVERAD